MLEVTAPEMKEDELVFRMLEEVPTGVLIVAVMEPSVLTMLELVPTEYGKVEFALVGKGAEDELIGATEELPVPWCISELIPMDIGKEVEFAVVGYSSEDALLDAILEVPVAVMLELILVWNGVEVELSPAEESTEDETEDAVLELPVP